MASELRVDTLKDASGANSIGLSYVANGSAKAWINLNGTGTISTNDSFNISSTNDDGTGDYTSTYTSAMSNSNYTSMGANDTITQDSNRPAVTVPESQTTTTLGLRNTGCFNNNTYYDIDPTMALVHGDLA